MYICFACRPNNDRLARAAGAFSASTILALLSFYKFHSFCTVTRKFLHVEQSIEKLTSACKKTKQLVKTYQWH